MASVFFTSVVSFVAPFLWETAKEVAYYRERQLKKYYKSRINMIIFYVFGLIIVPFIFDISKTQKVQTGKDVIISELLYDNFFLLILACAIAIIFISLQLNESGKILIGIFLIKTILFSIPIFQFYMKIQTSLFQSTSDRSLHIIMTCILLKICLNIRCIRSQLPSNINPKYVSASLTFILCSLTPGSKFSPFLRSIGEIAIISLFENEFTLTGCVNFLVYLGISFDSQSLKDIPNLVRNSLEKLKSLMGFVVIGEIIPDIYSVIILRLIRSAIVGWIAYLVYLIEPERCEYFVLGVWTLIGVELFSFYQEFSNQFCEEERRESLRNELRDNIKLKFFLLYLLTDVQIFSSLNEKSETVFNSFEDSIRELFSPIFPAPLIAPNPPGRYVVYNNPEIREETEEERLDRIYAELQKQKKDKKLRSIKSLNHKKV